MCDKVTNIQEFLDNQSKVMEQKLKCIHNRYQILSFLREMNME